MTEQTRFKYGLIFCLVVFIEAVLKHFLVNFPFDMAVAVQAAALGVYTVAESANNSTRIKASPCAGPVPPEDAAEPKDPA